MASAETNGGSSRFAICLLEVFFLREPLGVRALLARLLLLVGQVPIGGASWCMSFGLQALGGI